LSLSSPSQGQEKKPLPIIEAVFSRSLVIQAKNVRGAVFLLMRSRRPHAGNNRLIEHVSIREPRKRALHIKSERPESVGGGCRYVYGREQNHGEEVAIEEQSAETEYRLDAITDDEFLLRRDVRASERMLDMENAMTLAGQFL
jgi:hypothetical protein